jgi:prolyl-tRNA synthetase
MSDKTDKANQLKVTPRSEDYSRWYTDVIQRAELADYAPVRGCMVIRPYGYAIWENIQAGLDKMFKETGHKNAYFPMLIPESFLKKEAEHVEGFAPELAVVTIGGGKKLEEPLIVRPTSETIINHMFAQWAKSYRDLPILINQWCNVVRWELRTKLFLRTLEFLWQEGHTAHATAEEAEEETVRMLNVYKTFAEETAAIPVITGRKSDSEKFAGAVRSYSIEAMMGDRRALQSATSHNLGQNFAKAFGIQFLDRENKLQHAWQTSWGMSTRFVGAVIMVHGDDQGLVMPPKLAPVQAVIVPIWRKDAEKDGVLTEAGKVREILKDRFRVELDLRDGVSPGFKFNDWEMRGVPVRIEIGPKDIEKKQVVLARRDNREKAFVPVEHLSAELEMTLDKVQKALFQKARDFLEANTFELDDYSKFKEMMQGEGSPGFVRAWWCDGRECEAKIKEETKATSRCIPFDQPGGAGKCFHCGAEATVKAIFAKAY